MGVAVFDGCFPLPPRVDTEIDGGRVLPFPFTDSSRLSARSELLLPTTIPPRKSTAASPVPVSSIKCSPLLLLVSFMLLLMSPVERPVKLDTFSTSAVVPYIPFPLAGLWFVDDERFREVCSTD